MSPLMALLHVSAMPRGGHLGCYLARVYTQIMTCISTTLQRLPDEKSSETKGLQALEEMPLLGT